MLSGLHNISCSYVRRGRCPWAKAGKWNLREHSALSMLLRHSCLLCSVPLGVDRHVSGHGGFKGSTVPSSTATCHPIGDLKIGAALSEAGAQGSYSSQLQVPVSTSWLQFNNPLKYQDQKESLSFPFAVTVQKGVPLNPQQCCNQALMLQSRVQTSKHGAGKAAFEVCG